MGPGTDPAGQGRTPPDAGPAPSASIANTLSGAVPLNFSPVASGETRLERAEERGKPGRPVSRRRYPASANDAPCRGTRRESDLPKLAHPSWEYSHRCPLR